MQNVRSHAWLSSGRGPTPPARCVGHPDCSPAELPAAWLTVEHFSYEPLDQDWAGLDVLARLEASLNVPAGVMLLARTDRAAKLHPALGWEVERAGLEGSAGCLHGSGLWRVHFGVPLEVVRYAGTEFALTAPGREAIALPAPTLPPSMLSGAVALSPRRFTVRTVRRHVVAFTAGLALAGACGSAVGVADTVSTDTSTTASATTGQTDTSAPATTDTTTTTTATATAATTTTAAAATAPPSQPTASVPATPAASPQSGAPQAAPSTPSLPASGDGSSGHATKHAADANCKAPRNKGTKSATKAHKPATDDQRSRKCPATKNSKHKGADHRHDGGAAVKQRHKVTKPHTSAVPPKPTPPPPDTDDLAPPQTVSPFSGTLWTGDPSLDPFTTAEIKRFSHLIAKLDQPPKFLIPIYKAAGKRFHHIPWQILAAINAVETNYGRDLHVSPKGAIGWMQFMPATWMEYGMAVNGQTVPDPYNPRDAIFSAARYLAANGAPKHMRRALFAYNHARWYVDSVLWRAEVISDHSLKGRHGKHGYALPLDGRYMRQLGRTDDGVDIEDAPDGAAVYSITPGKVTAIASDPTGFGPNYPVIRVTKGPLAGQYIYYGHVAASLVHVGQHVMAGQPIAVMGHTGDAASLGHGHIEIGFSDALGDPLNHHGAVAWTPSGDAMRHVLIALSAAFKIKNS